MSPRDRRDAVVVFGLIAWLWVWVMFEAVRGVVAK